MLFFFSITKQLVVGSSRNNARDHLIFNRVVQDIRSFIIRYPAGYPISFAGYPVSFAGCPASFAGYPVSFAEYPVSFAGYLISFTG